VKSVGLRLNENSANKLSPTDWQRVAPLLLGVDALTDDEIDTSDIPELDASFFASATWREPPQPPLVAIPVEPEVLEWFKSQGDEYERRMTAALRIYAETHQQPRSHPVAA